MANIIGNRFNNVLRSNVEADYIDGGDGLDTVDYAMSMKGVSLDLAAGRGYAGDADGDVLVSIENVTGSANDDKITGSKFDNVLSGGKGRDYLDGGDGNDQLNGGDGADTLVAGHGRDTLDGGADSDMLIAALDSAQDVFRGGTGVDTIDYSLGSANDEHGMVIELGAADGSTDGVGGSRGYTVLVPITITTPSGTTTGTMTQAVAGVREDVLNSIENVIGTEGADYIVGNETNNRLEGRGGDDVLVGGSGTRVDVLIGGEGRDTVDYRSATYALNVQLSDAATGGTTVNLVPNDGSVQINWVDDQLFTIENVVGSGFSDLINGNSDDNVLVGGAGDDTISGGIGADTIDGGAGADRLSGNAGADVFVFQSAANIGAAAAHDHISQFQGGQDKIDLSAIDAVTGNIGNDAFHFSLAFQSFDGTAGALIVTSGASDDFGRQWTVLGDTNGDNQADFTLSVYSLYSQPNLMMTDFVL